MLGIPSALYTIIKINETNSPYFAKSGKKCEGWKQKYITLSQQGKVQHKREANKTL